MPRRVVVEIELGEGESLEELLKGVKYKVLAERPWAAREDRGRAVERFYGKRGSAPKELLDEFMLEAETQ